MPIGGVGSKGPVGSIHEGLTVRLLDWMIILWFMLLMKTQKHMLSGQKKNCLLKQNGRLQAGGGLDGMDFTWGNEDTQLTKPRANTWQGEFPYQNLLIVKYEWTSPVGSFDPNGYSLFDMAGNIPPDPLH